MIPLGTVRLFLFFQDIGRQGIKQSAKDKKEDKTKIKKVITTMQKITALILSLSLLAGASVLPAAAAVGEAKSWYVPRNGGLRPVFSEEQARVSLYDGYYMDAKVDDGSGDRVLYLTFDAGYENGNVEKILDALRDEGVPAAFFILDHLLLENSDLVIRMQKEGHLVCNHTKNHKDMTKCQKEEMIKNLTDLEKLCEEKTGKALEKYFRFPEGRYSESSLATARELGYKSIFWSFAYADWDNAKQPDPKRATEKILKYTHNGAVILLHPTSATNAEILPALLKEWKRQGYRFGTLHELTASGAE